MKILLTGSTSQHVNPDTHRKRVNFSGLIRDALRSTEDEVYWSEPSILWDDAYLKQFDAVVVGLAPLSSLGANRAYGALSVIGRLWNTKRLTILIDAPDPVKIETSLQAVLDHPNSLVKDFFSYRKEYRLACEKETFDRLLTAVHLLRTEHWRNVIFPGLPWQYSVLMRGQLKNTKIEDATLLNLDHLIFDRFRDPPVKDRNFYWAYEAGSALGWLQRQAVTREVTELPTTFRVPTNEPTVQQLFSSRGTMISPSKNGTWWSPRYAMSLSQGTPVFSDWGETSMLGESWTMLPSGFELLSRNEQQELMTHQTLSYRDGTLSRAESLDLLYATLHLPRKADTWMVG